MKKGLVSVIILQYNGAQQYTLPCIKSVLETKYKNYEVIVVDNNSSDNSAILVEKEFPQIKLIRSNKNLGFTGGNNLALNYAKGEYIAFLNNDTLVDPNWLTELVKATKEKKVAICQPKILSLSNKNKFDYAGAAGGFIDLIGFPFCRGRIFNTIEKDNGQYDDSIDIFWSTGTCLFTKRKILNEIGSFDNLFFLYYEEEDLCWRAHLRGYKVRYVPKAKIYHYGEATSKKAPFKKYYYLHRNHTLVLLKNYSIQNLVVYLPLKFISELIASLYFLANKEMIRSSAILFAFFWSIANLPLLYKERGETQSLRKISDREIMKYIYRGIIWVDYFIRDKKYFKDYKSKIEVFNN